MDAKKQEHLERAGWSVGDAVDFLKLSPEEAALMELRTAISNRLKSRRLK